LAYPITNYYTLNTEEIKLEIHNKSIVDGISKTRKLNNYKSNLLFTYKKIHQFNF